MASVVFDEDDFVPSFSEVFSTHTDLGYAEVVVGILRGDDVPAQVRAIHSPNGPPIAWMVCVDARHLHRARWIMRDPELTESELVFLATGCLGDESNQEP